jgi:ubiquinone/menaquinone biosynthesis C-methylase UbiE/glycosyltransferase involved in cell wall biosynthesis
MSIPDYYNRVNPDLLKLMPPDARVVVEVGCGAGALAEAYRRINPNVQYLGIEKVPEVAHDASEKGRVDRVFVGDAAQVEPADLELPEMDSSIDCLVFGDVLEHMVDPWTVLARLARWMCKGGQVLACIPNVQHYSILINLLRGKWEYENEGLLDRTHLRFFTLEGTRDLFSQAGLQVFDIQPRWWPSADFDKFQQIMTPVLDALAIEPTVFAAQTRAVQYIVRAIRSDVIPQRMMIWSLLGSVIGSQARVGEPGQFLATIPGVRTLSCTGLQFSDLNQTWVGEEKIFLQQRIVIPLADHIRLQHELLARGYLIIGEFDDDPQHFAELVRTDFFALRSCHCLQTTTEVMAETLRAFNPHVTVFPNQIVALKAHRAKPGDEHPPNPTTVFFGALNREGDWAPLMAVLNRVLQALGDQVRVQVVYDQAFFEALSTPNKVFEPLSSYDRYHELLHAADIALLPLELTRFNEHKSDLKFIECAAHSVAALASRTVYGRTIVQNETGLVYQSPGEFGVLLERLIRDVPLRRWLAENAYRYVFKNRLLSQHFRARYDWYRQMLERRTELEVMLHQRVPELFRD